MALTVVTYGGGEILENIFNAVSMFVNGGGSIIRPLMILSASISGFWAISKALFSPSLESIFSRYCLPIIVISSLFLIPSTTVRIEDVLKDRSYTVDHVPFLLGKFATLVSSLSYKMTKAVESVIHVPQDARYNKTGMIFGAETAIDISRFQITNGDLEQNLRRFSKQCVLYDIALGRYSLDEMKKATDLWKFFEGKTSKVRMMTYCPIGASKNHKNCKYLSCQEAAQAMKPFFEKEIAYYAQQDVIRNLPLTFQALTGLQKNAEELIGQQLMMHVLKDEYSGHNLAKSRAYVQQRNTMQTLGALAPSGLITMRAVLEALIYAAFIFIIPMALLPGGFKFISTWMWLTLWIQLWPPFYAILDYIFQIAAYKYSSGVFNTLTEAEKGLSFFTSVGLQNMQTDIMVFAGYLSLSIPFISYAILKGSTHGIVNLASSMTSPAQNAASQAASEQSTGNYSFANTSFGQTSFHNTTGFQSNLAPSLSSGYFTDNQGTDSVVYSGDQMMLRQGNSTLRTSLFSEDAISQSLQKQEQHAHSIVNTIQDNLSKQTASCRRELVDMTSHLANSHNYVENIAEGSLYDVQNSARYVISEAENIGKHYDLSAKETLDLALAGQLGGSFKVAQGSLGGTSQMGASRDEAQSAALNLAKNEEFQTHLQNIQNFARSNAFSSLKDEGVRLVEGYNHSIENVESSQQALQYAESKLDQISENVSWAKQHSYLIRKAHDQDFINWSSEKYADLGGFSWVQETLSKGSEIEKHPIYEDFIKDMKQQQSSIASPKTFEDILTEQKPKGLSIRVDDAIESEFNVLANRSGLNRGEPAEKGRTLIDRRSSMERYYESTANQLPSKIESRREEAKNEFQAKQQQHLITKAIKGVSWQKDAVIKYQLTEAPFWMSEKIEGQ
jgi:conjugal transfer mating pair stabilization protein TraG